MSKIINFDTEARNKLKKGIDLLANSVKVTLGPKGRSVIIEKQYGPPHITKDGVSVAKEIELKDPFENVGAQLVKKVASKTCDDVGDGTTTSTVLSQAIVSEGIKNLEAGANPVDIKKGIDIAVNFVVNFIKDNAIQIGNDFDKIEQVATISANNDNEIGKLITEAFRKVTKEGVITIEEAKSSETTISVVEGMQLDRGYASPYFVTNNDESECELINPYILIYNDKINDVKNMIHLLEAVLATSKPLLIITDDIDSEALSTLVVNKIKNNFKVCVVKSPGFGESRKEFLLDIAAVTGGKVVSEEFDDSLSKATIASLGSSEKVVINKDTTTIINGNGNKNEIESRVKIIKHQLESKQDSILQTRLARLSGGVAVLYIGAPTEVEMKEKKDRVDDALCATRAAIEEGIIPGGGTIYINAIHYLEKEKAKYTGDILTGFNIILKAITRPLYTIAENAGVEGSVVVKELLNLSKTDKSIGYNAKTDTYENMFLAGILDPAKVSRSALENAASIASLILTSGCVICDSESKLERTIM